MEILGVGPLELIFIFILVLLVLGPEEMVKTGRKMGEYWGAFLRSDMWRAFRSIRHEAANLPNKLAREAHLEELKKEVNNFSISGNVLSPDQAGKTPTEKPMDISSWVSPTQEATDNSEQEASDNDEVKETPSSSESELNGEEQAE